MTTQNLIAQAEQRCPNNLALEDTWRQTQLHPEILTLSSALLRKSLLISLRITIHLGQLSVRLTFENQAGSRLCASGNEKRLKLNITPSLILMAALPSHRHQQAQETCNHIP